MPRPKLQIGVSILLLLALALGVEFFRSRPSFEIRTGFHDDITAAVARDSEPLLPPLPDQNGVFRFATFNIHKGQSPDGNPVVSRLASIVDTVDVIGLQEAAHTGLDGVHDYSKTIAAMVGNRHRIFAPAERRWFRPRGGNAIVSNIEPENVRVSQLAGNRTDHRNSIDAELQLNQIAVRYINTHLTHRNRELRTQQFNQVVKLFLSSEHSVLVGDMNMRADDSSMKNLLANPDVVDALERVAKRDKRPDIKPDDDIDFILVHNLDVVDAGRLPPGLSDHPMLWADIRVPSAE